MSMWQVVSASVCGASHEKAGLPCQDICRWDVLSDDILVIAIADGAGSATLGEVGAAIAAQTAVETISLQRNVSCLLKDDASCQQLLISTLEIAQSAVEAEAKSRAIMARDLATTLILVIATSELVAAAHVGDGAVIVCGCDKNIIALTTPQSGEYINEVTFLISHDALKTAQIIVRRGGVKHIAALSDGLQMLALKMPEGVPHIPFFSPLFHFLTDITDESEAREQLTSFLRSSRITERTGDDLTLVLASFTR